MKILRCCFKYTLQQKVFILFLTLWLFSLLKLLNVGRLLFPQRDIYLVEYSLSTSPFVRNRFPDTGDAARDAVNCSGVYEHEPLEIGKSLEIRRRNIIDLEDGDVAVMTSDCDIYQTLRQYHEKPVSRVEEDFPIAYSLVVHKDAIMVERLIRAIYNQHNLYCIHYDLKSPDAFKAAMNNLAKCFSNIFRAWSTLSFETGSTYFHLEITNLAKVEKLQRSPCLPPLVHATAPLRYEFWGLISGSCARKASTLPTANVISLARGF